MERTRPDLTPSECWELLALSHVGRLALSIQALPLILPVRYAVDGTSVIIGLGKHGLPLVSIDDVSVAFAVDAFDVPAGLGWMVQLQGRTQLATPGKLSFNDGPVEHSQVVRLEPGTVTGSRFTFLPSPVST